jgi:membrane protein YqaA with SNARE-associated domain
MMHGAYAGGVLFRRRALSWLPIAGSVVCLVVCWFAPRLWVFLVSWLVGLGLAAWGGYLRYGVRLWRLLRL